MKFFKVHKVEISLSLVHPIKVVQFGFGSLGKEIFRTIHSNKKFRIVGVIDSDKNMIGKDAGMLAKNTTARLKIVSTIDEIKLKPHIILHATSSQIDKAYPQFCEIAKKHTSIISTCEELVYPYGKNKKIAKKIDQLAKRNTIQILGIGVNPGFLMDSFVLALTSLCNKIQRIKVRRIVNLSKRRKALQRKMCVGLNHNEFSQNKGVGHIGLKESAHMICDSLKVAAKIESAIKPIITKTTLHSNVVTIKSGQIIGIKHRLSGKIKNTEFLKMSLDMYMNAKEYDEVIINGTPPIHVSTDGIHGDKATIALLLNYIPIVLRQKPGLYSVNDLSFPTFQK